MKKLLMCYHSAEFGGIEQQISDIIRGLHEEIEIYVACPNGPMVREYLDYGAIKHIELFPKSEFDISYSYGIYKTIKNLNIDVIHAHELRTGCLAMIGAWWASCEKRIYHVHTSFLEWNHSGLKKYISIVPNFIANYIAGNFLATRVIALTKELKRQRINSEKINESKITVIPNGIDLESLKYDANMASEIRRIYGIPQDKTIIGNISRFTEEKGHEILIRAFAGLINDDKNELFLFLAGGGKLLDKCKNFVNELGISDRVAFTDRFPQEQKTGILSVFDYYVLPTNAEGFGIALIEGLANGRVVIASDIPVLKEVGGDAAVYFKVRDITELKNTLKQLLSDENTRQVLLGKGVLQASQYSLENFWDGYRRLYLS